MLQIVPQMRIFVAIEPEDFRRGIDGLSASCRNRLKADPMSGAMFLFRNRRGTAVKLLCYDGQGFWLCQKRFSRGRLKWWPKPRQAEDAGLGQMDARQLQTLLWNGDPTGARFATDWRPVPLAARS